jgi:glycosyltransferase involved in cell wall biosynthesis
MNRIDVLAYKMNSYDTEEFMNKIFSYSKESIILIFDFEKIDLRYAFNGYALRKRSWEFYKINHEGLSNLLVPVLFLINISMVFWLLLGICARYRPRIFWTENVYAACMVGILKKFFLCQKLIYVPGDWLVNPNNKKLWSYIANNMMFPVLDLFACRLSCIVLFGNERLRSVREKFWKRSFSAKVKMCSFIQFPCLVLKARDLNKRGNVMCFLGDRRIDSGLDIAIRSLPEIRKRRDIILKAIGPVRENDDYFKDLAKEFGVASFVEFHGYLASEDLAKALEDCFCGLNILTVLDSYSYYAFPGKQAHYLQYLLPIILTQGAGSLVPVIEKNALGIVIEPTEKAFIDAAIHVHEKQEDYKHNIHEFINNIKPIGIEEILGS